MKKVILMAAASLAIFATSYAQNAETTVPKVKTAKPNRKPATDAPAQGTPAPPAAEKSRGYEKGSAQGQGGGVNKALGLTAEQETKFKAINEGHKTATQAVQKDASMAADAKRAQVELLKSKYESEVQAVLTADQFAKWQEMRAKRGGPKGNHKKGNHKEEEHDADAATMPTPATGTAVPTAPAEGNKMKPKKSKKDQ